MQNTINQLNSEKQTLQSTNQELQEIVDLAKVTVVRDSYTLNQQAGGSNYFTVNTPYAGYIRVRINSSTTNLATVRVSYTSNGGKSPYTITYDQQKTGLATGNAVYFPVLPGTTTVYIGNTNVFNGATHTITIEYWY